MDRVRPTVGSRTALGSPWTVATVVFFAYGLWVLAGFGTGRDARDFILIGRTFLLQSHVSQTIKLDPHYHYLSNNVGYDGQFAYYIALDPVHARYYLDTHGKNNADPDYRYTRILYPMLARLLALGRADLIPYTLLLINWLAAAAGVFAVAAWLARRRVSPWFALVFGFYPGIFLAMERDLNEVLSFGLVALGVLLLDIAGRWRTPLAALAFACAALTRETTAVFPLAYGLAMIVSHKSPSPAGSRTIPTSEQARGQWRQRAQGIAFLAISLLPLVIFKVFLIHWLGTTGRTGGAYPSLIPFGGIASYWPWRGTQIDEALGVLLPSLLCGGMALWALARRMWSVEIWVLIVNIVLFVVFLNPYNYVNIAGSGRVSAGVVLGSLYCIPQFDRLTGGRRWWLWTAAVLWFFSLPALNPLWHEGVGTLDFLLVPGILIVTWLLTRVTDPGTIRTMPAPHPDAVRGS